MVYHLCFVAGSARAAIVGIEQEGFNVTVISEAKPAVLFGGREVSFYSVDGIGVIELIEGEPLQPDMTQGSDDAIPGDL
jgi:methylmalonyl-CoA/ethylmalonyl-CoA epimerase